MNSLIAFLERFASAKRVLFFFVLTNLVFGIMLFYTIPRVVLFSDGMPVLDTMPTGYDVTYVQTLFDSLGEAGRHNYLNVQIPVDLVYPLLFFVCYTLLAVYLMKHTNRLYTAWFALCFLPIIAAIADYAENISIINLLKSYPDLSENLIKSAKLFTIIKSSVTTVYFIGLFVLVAIWILRKLRSI